MIRRPLVVGQTLSLRSADLPLYTACVKAVKQTLQVGPEVKRMVGKGCALGETSVCFQVQSVGAQASQLEVFAIFLGKSMLQMRNQLYQFFRVAHKWPAVICKRDRNQPRSRQPASDPAEDNPIGKLPARRRSRKHDRFVPVRATQRFQPAGRMEDRGPRMGLKKLFPASILKRINAVTGHQGCGFVRKYPPAEPGALVCEPLKAAVRGR